jgi:hypothetical protein
VVGPMLLGEKVQAVQEVLLIRWTAFLLVAG